MTILDVKIRYKPDDIEGRSLIIGFKNRNVTLNSPLYSVNSSVAQGLNKAQVELVEIGLQINMYRLYRKIGLSNKELLEEYFSNLIQARCVRKGEHPIIIVPLIIGGSSAEHIDKKSISNVIEALYTVIGRKISRNDIDLSTIPLLYGKHVQKYKNTIYKTTLETLSTIIKQKVLAPVLSWDANPSELKTIVTFISKYSIMMENLVCIDFRGSNPVKTISGYRILHQSLNQIEEDTPIVRYGLNVQYSRVRRKTIEDPARDLISYYMGLDIIGSNHLPSWHGSKPPERTEKTPLKLLLRKRYTYVNLEYALEKYSRQVHEEYGMFAKTELTSLIEKYRLNLPRYINQLVASNLVEEVQQPIRNLFSNKGYKQYEKPMEYLLSKPIILEHPEITKTIEVLSKHRIKTIT